MKIYTRSRPVCFSAVLFGIIAIVGCGSDSDSSDCQNCVSINTSVVVNGMNQLDQNVAVSGTLALPPGDFTNTDCDLNPLGNTQFSGTTDGTNAVFTEAEVALGHNCVWSLFRNTSAKCPTANIVTRTFDVPGRNFGLPCGSEVNTFLASPNRVDPTAPSATITITGQNMDPTYAMPQVYFYDQNQTVWLQVTVSSASADGTSVVVPASQVTFPENYYAAVVYVKRSDGTWNAVGGAGIRVFTPIDPPTGGGGCTGRNCLPQC